MKLLLKGGTVVSAAGSKIADLLIEDEKIVRVGQDLTDAEATVVPMEGKLLFPGFIDAHTHFDLDVCNTTTSVFMGKVTRGPKKDMIRSFPVCQGVRGLVRSRGSWRRRPRRRAPRRSPRPARPAHRP